MSIESITERILAEAESYAQSKKQEAEAAKAAAIKEASDQVEGILSDAEARAKQDSELLIARRESVADLEARKMQLLAKQELIEESFNKALAKLQELDADEYVKFIMGRLQEFKGQQGEVLLSKNDLGRIKDSMQKELKGTKLTLSDEPADIQGGFILRQGNISYNSSLEMLLDDTREEMTSEIAKTLFGAE